MAPIGTSELTTAFLVVAVIGGALAVVSDDPVQLVRESVESEETSRSGEVGSTAVPTATSSGGSAENINESLVARELHVYLNARRTDNEDTSQFIWDSEMAQQAKNRAEWLASHQQLEHPEPAPYTCGNLEVTAFTYAYGEVRVDGDTISYAGDETRIAKGLLNQWEASEPARKTLYGSPYYLGAAGVATVKTSDGTRVYAVMAFCQRS